MENFFYLVIGSLITYLILQRPLQITVHHKHENLTPEEKYVDMKQLEEQMLQEDPKNDQAYEEFNKAIAEINDIMGGSDR